MRFVQANTFLYLFLLIFVISGFAFAVIWPQAEGFYSFILIAAAGGFGVAAHIRYIKSRHRQLVCPMNSDCNAVINSRYARFLGVSLEYWGMLYYAVIFISYLVMLLAPHLLSGFFVTGLMILTAGAFFFSLYLLFTQAFILRQWCIWCLLSAACSISIFISSLVSADYALVFLTEITVVIEAVHGLGLILGMGGATAAIFLFHRFLRDLDIDEKELRALQGVSQLVWLGLGLVLVGQFTTYVGYAETLALSGPFLAQMISLLVIAVSGAVLMIIITPCLAVIPFNEKGKDQDQSPLQALRKPLFITGAVALSSWYFAFVMNYLSGYGLPVLLVVYVVVLLAAIAVGLFWNRSISKESVSGGALIDK